MRGSGHRSRGNRFFRRTIKRIYERLKRNKALRPAHGDTFALIVDGHEQYCSRLRCCPGCLERTIHTNKGDVKEYYHRNVTGVLLCDEYCLPLDMEPQSKRGVIECVCKMALSFYRPNIFRESNRAKNRLRLPGRVSKRFILLILRLSGIRRILPLPANLFCILFLQGEPRTG